jgi:uncharacterized protein YjbJ (UPF0337 family)
MNGDEFQGGARYVGGKIETAVGDAVDSNEWRADGVIDQVAGGIQHTYGRARSIVGEAIDHAPELAADARDRLKQAGERVAGTAQRGASVASDTVRESPALWALAAALGGYAIAWAIHRRRG